MISIETEKKEAETPKRAISAESVLSYVIIGCFVVAVLGILATLGSRDSGGVSLLASAGALGVIAYIYCHKR
jgi:small-conductance mechanosensitive channel